MRPWQALLEIKWFIELNIALTSQPRPGLTILVFHQLWLKYCGLQSTLELHALNSLSIAHYAPRSNSQQVLIPESAASINTHVPLMNSEETFLTVFWKEVIMERQHSGQFYRSPLGVPDKYLTANQHLNWGDCTQITFLVNCKPELIMCSRTEMKSLTISEMK